MKHNQVLRGLVCSFRTAGSVKKEPNEGLGNRVAVGLPTAAIIGLLEINENEKEQI